MDDPDLPHAQGSVSPLSDWSPWPSSGLSSESTSSFDTPQPHSPRRNSWGAGLPRIRRSARIRRDAIVPTDLEHRVRAAWSLLFERPEVPNVITHTAGPITSGSQTPGLIYPSAGLRSGTRTPALRAATSGFVTPRFRRPAMEPSAPLRGSSSPDVDLRLANPTSRALQQLGPVSTSRVQSAVRELQADDRQGAVTVRRGLGLATPCAGKKRVQPVGAPRRHAKRRRFQAPSTAIIPVDLSTSMETVNQSNAIADQHTSNGQSADHAEMLISVLRETVVSHNSLDIMHTAEALESHPEVAPGVLNARILDGSYEAQSQMARVVGKLLHCIARCQADAEHIIVQQRNSVSMIVASTRVLSNPSLVETISSFIPIQERLRAVCAVAGLVRQPVDVLHPRLRSQVTQELWRLEHLLDRLQALYRELETHRDLTEPEEQGNDILTVRCPEIVDLVEFVATLQQQVESPVALDLTHAQKRVARKVLRLLVLLACKEVYQDTPRDQLGHRGSIRTAAVYARVMADSDVRFFWRRPHLFVKHEITAILFELCQDDWAWYHWTHTFDMTDASLVIPVFGGDAEVDLD